MFNKEIRLESERLLIRPIIPEDKEMLFNIMKDKEMFKYTPDEPWKSIEAAEEFIKLVQWLYALEHENFRHFFAVTEKESSNVVGICGVGGIQYDRSKNEIFYHIGRKHWGKGYATEAAKVMLKYYFHYLGLNEIIGAVEPANIASNRVMEKIGLKRAGTIDGLSEENASFNGEYLYLLRREDYGTKSE